MVLPKLTMPRFHLEYNYCEKKLNSASMILSRLIIDQERKRDVAKFAVPVILGVTALAILNVAAPLFDAFINFALDFQNPPLSKPRIITLVTFPIELALKVARTALNALQAPLQPVTCALNIGDHLHAMI